MLVRNSTAIESEMTAKNAGLVIASPSGEKEIKTPFKVTFKTHQRRFRKEDKAKIRRLKELKRKQRGGPTMNDMRDELEYRFYELEYSMQIPFLESLRLSLPAACDHYEWVKMEVAWVHFDHLPAKAVRDLFRFLRDKDLLNSKPGAADERTKESIRKRNAETRRRMAKLKEQVRSGQVDSGCV
ncbi:hypothetical protein AJ79_09867 [Helicocarpus griseus UAMH5409]|uniref:Uncharacterized protein n=1 Tax=Helicocarpus griseus UAMH5409 TaxID=1447875 RepID=A0A2B7WH03_9EURO|nr:hypothetical protein AJ79_09867 [Helicocarpus griseus UAMH5409]